MRIIGGRHGGRQLLGPPRGAATRPTSDKVREALFNVLADAIPGARVLDLFAGTGAFGLEALSRGAAHATFVEADRGLCDVIARNAATLGVGAEVTVVRRDVRRAGGQLSPQGYDVVFIDPPYQKGLAREALAVLLARGALAPGARVFVEHASREAPELPPDAGDALALERTRVYGDTSVTCYIAAATDTATATTAPPASGAAMPRIAIYPGSFDPMTNGHLDVIKRSLCMFDKLVIAVAANIRKNPLFDQAERIALIREVLGDDARVEVDTFQGLLVEYAKSKGAVAIVRGLRAVADFEYEFEMASMNRRLAPNVETVFLMTHESYFYVSSHLVKEVAALGGDIDAFVPPAVAARLKTRLPKKG